MKEIVTVWILALVMLGFNLSAWAQATQHTTVVKNLSQNPTLKIIGFTGKAETQAKLEETFRRCGWVEVLSKDAVGKADIQVTGEEIADAEVTLKLAVQADKKDFQTEGRDANAAVAVFEAVDGVLRELFNVQALCAQKIYYVVAGKNAMKEIFSCYLDGSGQERVTFNNGISTEPSWGHRNALVYTLAKSNAMSIVLADVGNGRQRIVSREPGLNSSAGLSHDGTLLALPMSFDGQVDLYLLNLKAGRRIRLTKDRNVESSPCWSPDNQKIVFVSDRLGTPQLYLMEASAEAKAERLTIGGRESVSPDWSNVSNRLCFTMKSNAGQYVVAMMDMGDPNRPVTVLTHAAGNWEEPSWAPDGRHIVCSRKSVHANTSDLYVIDSWLSTFRPISKNANLTLPAWRPAY